METVTLKIDGQDVRTWYGATILETALDNKIYIPHLCYYPDLKPAGSCRTCLVELDNRRLVTACRTPVREGMVVSTKGSELDKVRRPVLEMVIANHHMDCKHCPKKGQCALQKIMAYMKIDKKKIREHMRLPTSEVPRDESNPFFIRDHNKCVLCGICVQTCKHIAAMSAIDFAGRGIQCKVAPFADRPIAESVCTSCGECVVRCPVGALVLRDAKKADTWVKSVCPYCGVGCGVRLGIRDHEIVRVKADASNPASEGHLCVKGRFGMGFVNSAERLKEPLVRKGLVRAVRAKGSGISDNGGMVKVSWDTALDLVARNLKKYTGNEFALIGSTKCTNEDNYVAQKFARVVMGSNNIDTSARLTYGPNITALQRTGQCVGFSGPDGCEAVPMPLGQQREETEAACILIAGANITQSHPVLGAKIKKTVQSGASLLVISPHEIELCRMARQWMKPYPGTELALLMGMCRVIVEEELLDSEFVEMYCRNFEEFRESLDDFPLGRVERITGVPREQIEESARIYALDKPSSIFWGSGITQCSHGTDNVYALMNLAILSANIKYSLALNPLAEQSNTLGACDAGCVPDYYPCYQPVDDPEVRARFEKMWNCTLNPKPGFTFVEIIDAVLDGKIKALYIIGSNPLVTVAPSKKVRAALKKAKFVVVQDLFLNETARCADVVLPASSFAEKAGTFTNTDGKTQRIENALEPSGDSMPDWKILCRLADRLNRKGFEFISPEHILMEVMTLIQNVPETIGKFSLFPLHYKASVETPDMDYPLFLTKERDLYADGSMSSRAIGLRELGVNNCLQVNPKDAADLGIGDGEMVRIVSRHGSAKSRVLVTGSTPAGLAVLQEDHEQFNSLVDPVLDATSRTPEMSVCSVRLEKVREIKKRKKISVTQ